jgi:hypothetical protein
MLNQWFKNEREKSLQIIAKPSSFLLLILITWPEFEGTEFGYQTTYYDEVRSLILA